jgi:uncharacterized coiled-coil DUF342 family protein
MLEGWVRFWYKGELLPLPAEWQRQLQGARKEAKEAREEATEAREEAKEARQQAAAEREKREELERKLAQLLAQQGQPGDRPGNAS